MKFTNITVVREFRYYLFKICPQLGARILYRLILKKKLNLSNPKDLNEKINYLKFHENMQDWANLADKYAVRKYVTERGLAELLPPLYGRYESAEELIRHWETLPERFVIKSNNSCGTIWFVRDKKIESLDTLRLELDSWLKPHLTDTGVWTVEPHYQLISPCLIVEKLLEDKSVNNWSNSMVDYKVWCFNGNPYCIFVAYNRDVVTHHVCFDVYDLQWRKIAYAMIHHTEEKPIFIPKPINLDYLLECARILSKGHKQVRVDLYDINGRIYFGEMTFTSQGGYMDYFTPEFLLELGNQFDV